jgi:hypothetical protein
MIQYSERERPSPHKLSLCMLLQIWVMPRRPEYPSGVATQINQISASLSARGIRDLVEFLASEVSALDRKATERTMADIVSQLQQRVSGQDIVDCLRRKINSILSPDDLIDLFTSLKGLLSAPSPSESGDIPVQAAARPTHLDHGSVFGIYIRRMLLVYHQMMFGAVSSLFEEMVVYQEEFRQSQEVPVLTMAEEFRRKQRFLSSRQLQLYLEQKANEIEKGLGVRPHEEMEAEIDAMLEVAPDLPRAYFLRYLVCLHHREFQGALNSLHRYFDFCLRRGGPSSAGSQHGTIQYASLSLAALYLSFGFPQESLIALQETVRVAQQQNDHVCVAYSLSWLHQAMSAVNHPLAYQHLARCLARARELNLPHLHTLTSLAMTQHNLLRPRPQAAPTVHLSARPHTAHPLQMWQTLHTSVVDWRACSSVGDGGAVGAAPAVAGAAVAGGAAGTAGATGAAATAAALAADAASKQGLPRDMHQLNLDTLLRLSGQQQLLRSSSWALFGHQKLAQLAAQLGLHCYCGQTAAHGTALAMSRIAESALYPEDTRARQPAGGNPSMWGRMPCVYATALQSLYDAQCALQRSNGDQRGLTVVQRSAVKLLHDRAVNRQAWAEAAVHGRTLYSLSCAPDEPMSGQAEANMIEVRHASHAFESHALESHALPSSCLPLPAAPPGTYPSSGAAL